MEDNHHSLINKGQSKSQRKDTENQRFRAQKKRVYSSFSKYPKTMKQVSKETNIMRSNICRYIALWRKTDKIGVAKYGRCPVTKWPNVTFFTTDPNQFITPKHKK